MKSKLQHIFEKTKPLMFKYNKKDPELAHSLFINFLNFSYDLNLLNQIYDNDLKENPNFKLSNAAGFNKNGLIHPLVLKKIGFDRNTIGTVTGEAFKGNNKPRAWRFPQSESLVNNLGLPGIGAEDVSILLELYDDQNIPTTLNLMSTPGKTGKEKYNDIKFTIKQFNGFDFIDRIDLNVSCPNTNENYVDDLKKILDTTFENYNNQSIFLKLSPDLSTKEMEDLIKTSENYPIDGFTLFNTTKYHDPRFISKKIKKGGASGDALYEIALNKQKEFMYLNKQKDYKYVIVGGIKNQQKLEERLTKDVIEVRIYTPLIFKGPDIIKELKSYKN